LVLQPNLKVAWVDTPLEDVQLEVGRKRWAMRPQELFTWNNFLRLAGLVGIGHETLIASQERPTLLVLFGAMIGLPSFLTKDKESK
jgi:hypothetical protein